jgi:hypothetical protein
MRTLIFAALLPLTLLPVSAQSPNNVITMPPLFSQRELKFLDADQNSTTLSKFCGTEDYSCEWYNLRLEQRTADAARQLLSSEPNSYAADYARATIELAAAHESYLNAWRGRRETLTIRDMRLMSDAMSNLSAAMGKQRAEWKLMEAARGKKTAEWELMWQKKKSERNELQHVLQDQTPTPTP